MLKYGINEILELRLIAEYLGTTIRQSEMKKINFAGFGPLALGVKIKLWDEKGLLPQAGLISHVRLKSGSSEFVPPYTGANFRFTFAHTLSNAWSLSYNLGAQWNGDDTHTIFLYTLSLGYSINDKLAVFAEGYSFIPEGLKADNRIDAGFTYKITPIFQFDVSGGIGLSENAPDYFLSSGFSVRMFK